MVPKSKVMFIQIVNKSLDACLIAPSLVISLPQSDILTLVVYCFFVQWSFVKRSMHKLPRVFYEALLMQNIYGHVFAYLLRE